MINAVPVTRPTKSVSKPVNINIDESADTETFNPHITMAGQWGFIKRTMLRSATDTAVMPIITCMTDTKMFIAISELLPG